MKPMPKKESIFVYTFRLRLDDSGRVRYPRKWQAMLRRHRHRTLWITIDDEHLSVLSKAQIDRVLERFRRGTHLDGVSADQLSKWRLQLANRRMVTVDAYGRFKIPAELRRSAGLKRDVVAVGMLEYVQLWAPRRWKAEMARIQAIIKTEDIELSVK